MQAPPRHPFHQSVSLPIAASQTTMPTCPTPHIYILTPSMGLTPLVYALHTPTQYAQHPAYMIWVKQPPHIMSFSPFSGGRLQLCLCFKGCKASGHSDQAFLTLAAAGHICTDRHLKYSPQAGSPLTMGWHRLSSHPPLRHTLSGSKAHFSYNSELACLE